MMQNEILKASLYVYTVVTTAVIILFILGYLQYKNPVEHFYEGRPGTYFSFFLLLFSAYYSYKVYKLRKKYIWLIFSIGFVYLGLDEIIAIHEKIDWLFHQIFRIKETKITDNLDNLVLVIYAVVGIILIKRNIKELRQGYFLNFFLTGMALFLFMIIADIINSAGLLFPEIFEMVEELTKLLAESSFLLGIYSVYIKAKI